MADADTLPSIVSNTTLETVYTATIEFDKRGERKQPKRVLHFSDGILEEYSSDDSENEDAVPETVVDPSMLAWTPWCIYYLTLVARKSLAAADFCGEKLAWFFGITTPKYQYALEEYRRMEKEIELERMKDQKLYEETQGLSSVDVQVIDPTKPTQTQIPKTSDLEETEGKF